MATAKIRLSFGADSAQPQVFERVVELGDLREDGGREFIAQHLFSELEKDSHYVEYRSVLPSIDSFLRPVKQTYHSLKHIDAGAVYFAELKDPLDFGSEPITPQTTSMIGASPPPGSFLRARLLHAAQFLDLKERR